MVATLANLPNELKDPNFPDLLDGVPAAPVEVRRKRKKNKKKTVDPARDLLDTLLEEQEKEEETSSHTAEKLQAPVPAETVRKLDYIEAVDLSPTPSGHSNRSPTAVDADIQQLPGKKGSAIASLTAETLKVSPHLHIPDLRQGDGNSTLSETEHSMHEPEDEEKSCSDTEEEEEEEDVAELIKRAQDRVVRQELQERVVALESALAEKTSELRTMHGQLRMATATKCDLVVAHNELERTHETAVAAKDQNLLQMQRANKFLLEHQAQTDFELLNELIRVTDMFHGLQRKHQEELDDWERMHRNEMLEKDYEIARLVEELRQAGLRPLMRNDN